MSATGVIPLTFAPISARCSCLRATARKMDPSLPVYLMKTVERQRHDSLSVEKLAATLAGAFGALATALSAVGLDGSCGTLAWGSLFWPLLSLYYARVSKCLFPALAFHTRHSQLPLNVRLAAAAVGDGDSQGGRNDAAVLDRAIPAQGLGVVAADEGALAVNSWVRFAKGVSLGSSANMQRVYSECLRCHPLVNRCCGTTSAYALALVVAPTAFGARSGRTPGSRHFRRDREDHCSSRSPHATFARTSSMRNRTP